MKFTTFPYAMGPFYAMVIGSLVGLFIGLVTEYYTAGEFSPVKKVAQAVNTNTISTLGNTGPKTEMGTSFGGGGDATVTGRERQIKLDPALKDIQSLAKEKENATDEKSYYMPKPPEDLQFVLHGAEADPIYDGTKVSHVEVTNRGNNYITAHFLDMW